MAINWNKNTIRWFRDASEYTGYNREMAKLILERIGSRGTLCDIGCGAAQIDFELAPHIDRITCVDLSQTAISGVDEEIKSRGVENITTVCADATTLNERFDTVLMLFCGEDYFYEKCFPLATERMIFTIVPRTALTGAFGQSPFLSVMHRITPIGSPST
ncbi:MAG: methyltransferase domain-containing protein [Oscillospiraceae bacterium]|nr:methyltransferase domain-containing protein [Oscillospiraceae bacterium]